MTLFLLAIGVKADLFFQQYTRSKVLNAMPSLSYGLLRDDFLPKHALRKKSPQYDLRACFGILTGTYGAGKYMFNIPKIIF